MPGIEKNVLEDRIEQYKLAREAIQQKLASLRCDELLLTEELQSFETRSAELNDLLNSTEIESVATFDALSKRFKNYSVGDAIEILFENDVFISRKRIATLLIQGGFKAQDRETLLADISNYLARNKEKYHDIGTGVFRRSVIVRTTVPEVPTQADCG